MDILTGGNLQRCFRIFNFFLFVCFLFGFVVGVGVGWGLSLFDPIDYPIAFCKVVCFLYMILTQGKTKIDKKKKHSGNVFENGVWIVSYLAQASMCYPKFCPWNISFFS